MIGPILALACVCGVMWVYADAKRRGLDDLPAVSVSVLVFFTWPIGLVAWVLMRPAP